MGSKLNKSAYQELIDEDIAWLNTSYPHSLERQHIEVVLNHSVGANYGDIDRLKTDLVAAIRLGLSGDTKSLEMLARRSTQRYKMRDLMQPIFDEFPAAKGSPLREPS